MANHQLYGTAPPPGAAAIFNLSGLSTSPSTNLLRKRMEMGSDPDASFLASSAFGGRSRSQSSADALPYSPADVVGYSSYASGLGARSSWSYSHLHPDDVSPLLSGTKRPSQGYDLDPTCIGVFRRLVAIAN